MNLPLVSVSQRIGMLGAKAFFGRCPDAWIKEAEPIQGGDFGFDGSMWVEKDGHIRGRFAFQLKAEVAPEPVFKSTNPRYSVGIARSQCNLFLQDGHAVLLVLVALVSSDSSAGSVIHYDWIEEQLRARLAGRDRFDENDPEEMTFHVPVSSVITSDLDIWEHLDHWWSENREARKVLAPEVRAAIGLVQNLSLDAATNLSKLDPRSLGGWLEQGALSGDAPWSIPESGTDTFVLKSISDAIRAGNLGEADSQISSMLPRRVNLPVELQAELSYQEGRRSCLAGEAHEAESHFEEAARLQAASERYFLAWMESSICAKTHDIDALRAWRALADARPSSSDLDFQIVRIDALLGNASAVGDRLATMVGAPKAKAEILFALIEDRWEEAISIADRRVAERDLIGLTRNDVRFLELLRVRAMLTGCSDENGRISIGGSPDVDLNLVVRLREETMRLLQESSGLGWPMDSSMLIDCASAVALMCGSEASLVSMVDDLAKKRPSLRAVQETAARVGALGDNPSVAIAAANRLPSGDREDMAKQVILFAETGDHVAAVDLAIALIDEPMHSLLADLACAVASVSAHRISKLTEERRLLKWLDSDEVDSQVRVFFDFLMACACCPEDHAANLDVLWNKHLDLAEAQVIEDNLFLHLRLTDPLNAARIIYLGDKVRARRGMTRMEAVKYCAALLEAERYIDVLSVSERFVVLFNGDEGIALCRSIAFDRLGDAEAAQIALEGIGSTKRIDILQAKSQLFLLSGDFRSAIEVLQRALAASSDGRIRFKLQRMICHFLIKVDAAQYADAVWRLGELSERESEEEGVFLALAITSLAGAGDPETMKRRQEEFASRADVFTNRYPSSSVFAVAHLDDSEGASGIISQLEALTGESVEGRRNRMRAKNLGDRVGSHIPFVMRPRLFAPYAQDVVHLFQIHASGRRFGEWDEVRLGDGAGVYLFDIQEDLVLDLLTLLVLVDLDLFSPLVSMCHGIVIPRVVIQKLIELQLAPFGAADAQLVDKVLAVVREHRRAISQPSGGHITDLVGNFGNVEIDAIKRSLSAGGCAFLSYDGASSLAFEEDRDDIVSFPSFLAACLEREVISVEKYQSVQVRLASWSTIGLVLRSDEVLFALADVSSGRMVDEAADGVGGFEDRVIASYLAAHATANEMLDACAEVVLKISLMSGEDPTRKAIIFLQSVLRHVFYLNVHKMGSTVDGFIAVLAAKTALRLVGDEVDNPEEHMNKVWRWFRDSAAAYGLSLGSVGEGAFFNLLGRIAEKLLGEVVTSSGLQALALEADVRSTLFSVATAGTIERQHLEDAYYAASAARHTGG